MLSVIFGKTLRELRIKNSLSQEKLAELAGYDRTYISLLERGLRKPTIKTLFDLSKALGISPHEFVKTVEELLK